MASSHIQNFHFGMAWHLTFYGGEDFADFNIPNARVIHLMMLSTAVQSIPIFPSYSPDLQHLLLATFRKHRHVV